MFCPKCGAQNDDSASTCAQCGESLQQQPQAPQPEQPVARVPSYLVQSILITIFCCLPLGVVAIVFAAQVDSKVKAGDYEGAVDLSNKAKMFCWIGFGLGLVGALVWILLVMFGVVAGSVS